MGMATGTQVPRHMDVRGERMNAVPAGRESTRGPAPLLEMRGISKAFGGTQALSDVTVTLKHGEVLALLGENGAGKSTLIKTLAGVHSLDHGQILFEGQDVSRSPTSLPIAFIHQDLGLIDWMTVAENVCLTRGFPRRAGMAHGPVSWSKSRQVASAALAKLGIDIDPDARVNQLGRIERSLVAIARALTTDALIIVMDEPTASLPADEVNRLFDAIRPLRAQGIGIIYVSHRLEEIFSIADRVVVLRDGHMVGERDVAETSPEELVRLIIGKSAKSVMRRTAKPGGAPLLEVSQAVLRGVGPIDLEVRPGEIVGLTGLRGAGQEAFARALFGLIPLEAGSVRLDGRQVSLSGTGAAISEGIRYASGDRTGESIVHGFSVTENFFLNKCAFGGRWFSRLRHREEEQAAERLGRHVQLRPNDPGALIESLSGGNQQKVVLGRWMHLKGRLLILEDPTAGVDIGAKNEIYRLLFGATEEKLGIVLVSTDFVEVAALCDRALVFSRGRIVGALEDAALTPDNLLTAAAVTAAA